MRGTTKRIMRNLEHRRQERRLMREYYALTPRVQEELFEVLRRSDDQRG